MILNKVRWNLSVHRTFRGRDGILRWNLWTTETGHGSGEHEGMVVVAGSVFSSVAYNAVQVRVRVRVAVSPTSGHFLLSSSSGQLFVQVLSF